MDNKLLLSACLMSLTACTALGYSHEDECFGPDCNAEYVVSEQSQEEPALQEICQSSNDPSLCAQDPFVNYTRTPADFRKYGERTPRDWKISQSGAGNNLSASIPPSIEDEVIAYEAAGVAKDDISDTLVVPGAPDPLTPQSPAKITPAAPASDAPMVNSQVPNTNGSIPVAPAPAAQPAYQAAPAYAQAPNGNYPVYNNNQPAPVANAPVPAGQPAYQTAPAYGYGAPNATVANAPAPAAQPAAKGGRKGGKRGGHGVPLPVPPIPAASNGTVANAPVPAQVAANGVPVNAPAPAAQPAYQAAPGYAPAPNGNYPVYNNNQPAPAANNAPVPAQVAANGVPVNAPAPAAQPVANNVAAQNPTQTITFTEKPCVQSGDQYEETCLTVEEVEYVEDNMPESADDPIQDWVADEGQNLKALLTEWSDESGWRLVWNTNRNYVLSAGAMFRGRFTDVSSALIRAFARARPAPIATFYNGNRVLVVETMEDENAYE